MGGGGGKATGEQGLVARGKERFLRTGLRKLKTGRFSRLRNPKDNCSNEVELERQLQQCREFHCVMTGGRQGTGEQELRHRNRLLCRYARLLISSDVRLHRLSPHNKVPDGGAGKLETENCVKKKVVRMELSVHSDVMSYV